MKKAISFSILSFIVVIFLAACNKENRPTCTNNTLEKDKSIIDSFIRDKGYSGTTFNPSYNVYTGIITPGTGSAPAADSIIVYKSIIRLMNGTMVDSGTVSRTNVGYPIRLSDYATQSLDHYVFSSLKENGTMRIIMLSSLNGLGCVAGAGKFAQIPANSQLINEVTLVDVSKN